MKNTLLPIAALLLTIGLSTAQDRGATSHSSSPTKTTVMMKGIDKPIKVMQITDTHVSCDNHRDKPFDQYSTRMRNAFDEVRHYKSGDTVHPSMCFADLMDEAVASGVDMIVLTGDIINYPAQSSVDFILGQLQRSGKPFIYTSGNHDWHYEGMPGSADSQREKWTNSTLKPLYQGQNAAYSSTVAGGINFVAIDNSTYQVSAEQLAFFEGQKKLRMPIVLLMHIPLYVEGGDYGCGNPAWGYDSDREYEIERRERWPKSGNSASTTKFLKEVTSTEGIVLLTGHTHNNRVDIEGDMVQYVSDGNYNGSSRIVEFRPAK